MSPEKGPRRHFTHQMYSPSFTPNNYEEKWAGRTEKKILLILDKINIFKKKKNDQNS